MQQIILEANNPRNKEKAYIEKPQYMMTYIHQTNQSQNKRAQKYILKTTQKTHGWGCGEVGLDHLFLGPGMFFSLKGQPLELHFCVHATL